VQVTHCPPARTKVDLLYTGAHAGSETIRKFIEEKQPAVAISAHIHEARGTDELGKTKLINSGRFPEGYCGLVSIEKDEVKAKIINLI
jgi:Icc-related predicted phosphoesterase